MNIIQFIEAERVKQKVTKRDLSGSADISAQYYDNLINGKSIESRAITELLLLRLGFRLIPVPATIFNEVK
jgi:transcriptional regulator with XRE-family HTH domain